MKACLRTFLMVALVAGVVCGISTGPCTIRTRSMSCRWSELMVRPEGSLCRIASNFMGSQDCVFRVPSGSDCSAHSGHFNLQRHDRNRYYCQISARSY